MSARHSYNRLISHKCGHHAVHDLHCKCAAEADTQAFNLSQKECLECWQQSLNKPAVLVGTDKQVKWADAIRTKFFKALGEHAASLHRITEAKWFIDHRDCPLEELHRLIA